VRVKYWEIIADNLSKAGWSWGCASAVDFSGRTIWIADPHRDDGKRLVVHACASHWFLLSAGRFSRTSSRRCRIGKMVTVKSASAFFSTIFVMVGGFPILLALPADDPRETPQFRRARAELGLPRQRETERVTRHSTIWRYAAAAQLTQAKSKPEKRATRRRRYIAPSRPNFLQRLFASLINRQKPEPTKTVTKGSHTTSRRGRAAEIK
jgi:hypothetical protein